MGCGTSTQQAEEVQKRAQKAQANAGAPPRIDMSKIVADTTDQQPLRDRIKQQQQQSQQQYYQQVIKPSRPSVTTTNLSQEVCRSINNNTAAVPTQQVQIQKKGGATPKQSNQAAAGAAMYPKRVPLPLLENKPTVTLNDHFNKQQVEVPILSPVIFDSSIFRRRQMSQDVTGSLNSMSYTPNMAGSKRLGQGRVININNSAAPVDTPSQFVSKNGENSQRMRNYGSETVRAVPHVEVH